MWTVPVDVLMAIASWLIARRLHAGATDAAASSAAFAAILIPLQLIGIAALGAYRPAPPFIGTRRFIIGAALGTLLAGLATPAILGSALAPSRYAAAVAGLIFGGVIWRCVVGLWRLAHPAAPMIAPPAGMTSVSRRRELLPGAGAILRYRSLIANLVLRDLKLKYRGSALGFFWSLLNPLVMVAVYTLAFTFIMKNGKPAFILHLMVGLLPWTFFASSAGMATGAIIDAGGLIKSVYFPRAILPVAAVFFNLTQYLLSLVVFVPVLYLYYQLHPSSSMLAFPLLLALQVLFTLGVALMLSSLTAIYRDVKHLTEIALSMLFWLTPIIYAMSDITSEKGRRLLAFSPLSPFITGYQSMFYDQVWPAWPIFAIAGVYATAAMLIGAILFLSLEERFAEQI